MIFNSWLYVVFLILVVTLYYQLPNLHRKILLLIASYIFYGMWDARFLSLLILSTVMDYNIARWLAHTDNPKTRRLILAISLAVNLSILGVFKYFNFFAENLVALFDRVGIEVSYRVLDIVLPVGISFYTFQTLSYTIDVYRKQCKPAASLLDFATYIAFFPQLVAGPIERASHLLPQFEVRREFNRELFLNGLWLIVLGLFKKVVLADRCAAIVDAGFQTYGLPEGLGAWLILYAFAIQIYGDFSGYTDIARGSAQLMGYTLMVNFRSPYLVSNPAAFWQHWHISLSTWLRDYLYIPLGGNRHGKWLTQRNLMITMLLGGLWHGAGWAFLIWGLYQGLLLVLHRQLQKGWSWVSGLFSKTVITSRAWSFINIVVFFHFTCLGWLLFRAANVNNGDQIDFLMHSLTSLVSQEWGSIGWGVVRSVALCGLVVVILQYACDSMDHFHRWHPIAKVAALTLGLASITSFGISEGAQFIYFQF